MRNFISTIGLLLFSLAINSQTWDWLERVDGEGESYVNSLVYDHEDNLIIAGGFTDSVFINDFVLHGTAVGVTSRSVFIMKVDENGAVLWGTEFSTPTLWRNIYCKDIATDASGNILILGTFGGEFSIGNETFTSQGTSDIFVAKLDPSGNVLWAKQGGLWRDDEDPRKISTDPSGNVYIAGNCTGDLTFDTVDMYAGTDDLFFAKYDTDGNIQWAKSAGSIEGVTEAHEDNVKDLAVDSQGNLYLTGGYWNTANFDDVTINIANGTWNAFMAKYDTDGEVVFVKNIGQSNIESGHSIEIDNDGNIVLAGYMGESLEMDGITVYEGDMFIAKLNDLGNTIWLKSTYSDIYTSSYGVASNIVVDDMNNYYLSGTYQNAFFFEGNEYASIGGNEGFLMQLNSDGGLGWMKTLTGTGTDNILDVDVNTLGEICIAGYFNQSVDFGGQTLTADPSYNDGYIAKLIGLTTNITEGGTVENIQVYPNPSEGLVYLNKDSQWTAYSILGTQLSKGKGSFIDMSNYPTGAYFIKVGEEVVRVVKN